MNYVLRTLTFVPGFRDGFLEKSKTFNSDALILDLEDSVPPKNKAQARIKIKQFLIDNEFRQNIFVRLNSLDSGELLKDLKEVLTNKICGFMPTMITDDKDIIFYDKLLSQLELAEGIDEGHFKLIPLIETGSALLKLAEIASSSERIIGLALGAEDYLTDLDGLHKKSGSSLLVARSMIVMAASANKIAAIDTPFLDIRDHQGYRDELNLARELGFNGQLILHPDQIDLANEIFSPSVDELKHAQKVVDAVSRSSKEGEGVTLLDGSLIGPPMEKRARRVLKKAEFIRVNAWQD